MLEERKKAIEEILEKTDKLIEDRIGFGHKIYKNIDKYYENKRSQPIPLEEIKQFIIENSKNGLLPSFKVGTKYLPNRDQIFVVADIDEAKKKIKKYLDDNHIYYMDTPTEHFDTDTNHYRKYIEFRCITKKEHIAHMVATFGIAIMACVGVLGTLLQIVF